LLVDATRQPAVVRLRQRKHRPDRPLAVMMPSMEAARRSCEISAEEARALASPAAPILLLRRRDPGSDEVAEAVAPGNPYLGVMLPYTPLHHLLMAAVDRPLVCTSGNLSEEPMAIDVDDARQRLGTIADLVLTHDRPIVRPVDDSVARVGPEGLQVLRRARGYAPLPIALGFPATTILAVGGHLKNTVALAIGRPGLPTPVVLSPHVGDLDSVLSVALFRRTIEDLVAFFEARPQCVACDLHPDYASTRHAEGLAAGWGVPLVRVQHHHAHVAACMAEHGLRGPVLGLAWDGTGYGPDGTVWGGEALLCREETYRRVAHLRLFSLPGGDAAVREPRRTALGMLFEILGPAAAEHAADWFRGGELDMHLRLLAGGRHAARTSSMGRLFDAVAVLCGLPRVISFEAQSAMAMEFAAAADVEEAYPLPLVADFVPAHPGPPTADVEDATADWEPLVRAILADRAAGEPIGRISARFHNALAELAVAMARHGGCSDVALTGGCFQNALLAERVRARLRVAGFSVFTHRQVPPGDGGIALGQVFVAAQGSHHVPGNSR
jgi:hydrogenase maturation protein HypF